MADELGVATNREVPPPPQMGDPVRLAPHPLLKLRRVQARVIDVGLWIVVWMLIRALLVGLIEEPNRNGGAVIVLDPDGVAGVLTIAVACLMEVGRPTGSFGKRYVRLRVVTLEATPLGRMTTLTRFAPYMLVQFVASAAYCVSDYRFGIATLGCAGGLATWLTVRNVLMLDESAGTQTVADQLANSKVIDVRSALRGSGSQRLWH